MICTGCGAPIAPSLQPSSSQCQYCGKAYVPEHTKNAGASHQTAAGCPVCQVGLEPITFDEQYHGHICPNCHGLLFNQKTFKRSIKTLKVHDQNFEVPLGTPNVDRQVHCPVCKKAMHAHPHKGSRNILVDTCQTCKLIWLDEGEFDQAIAAESGKTSSKPRDNAHPAKQKKKYSEPKRAPKRVGLPQKELKKGLKKIKKKAKFDLFDILEDIFD